MIAYMILTTSECSLNARKCREVTGLTVIGKIPRKLKTLSCHGKLNGTVIFMNLMSAEGADSFHEGCADDPATLSSQMQKLRAWFVYCWWPLWETAFVDACADPGRKWYCSSDWITILRTDNLGIGGHSEASKSEHWTRKIFGLISADKRAIVSRSIKVGKVHHYDQKIRGPMPQHRPEKKAVLRAWRLRAYPLLKVLWFHLMRFRG